MRSASFKEVAFEKINFNDVVLKRNTSFNSSQFNGDAFFENTTIQWIFEIFMGVIQAIVIKSGKIIKVSVNLSSTQKTILLLLGQECKNYYGMN
jgi:hypothetical protein